MNGALRLRSILLGYGRLHVQEIAMIKPRKSIPPILYLYLGSLLAMMAIAAPRLVS
jgi:hypothetical protein